MSVLSILEMKLIQFQKYHKTQNLKKEIFHINYSKISIGVINIFPECEMKIHLSDDKMSTEFKISLHKKFENEDFPHFFVLIYR
jgi:hypothetical protein